MNFKYEQYLISLSSTEDSITIRFDDVKEAKAWEITHVQSMFPMFGADNCKNLAAQCSGAFKILAEKGFDRVDGVHEIYVNAEQGRLVVPMFRNWHALTLMSVLTKEEELTRIEKALFQHDASIKMHQKAIVDHKAAVEMLEKRKSRFSGSTVVKLG